MKPKLLTENKQQNQQDIEDNESQRSDLKEPRSAGKEGEGQGFKHHRETVICFVLFLIKKNLDFVTCDV